MDLSLFRHKITEVVRFHEVDLLGVCNNAVYFNYFEDARIRYVQDLKKQFSLKEVLEGYSFFIMVHNDCDYHKTAVLDDELTVLTRVNFVKNTSFGFKHAVVKEKTGEIIASGGGVVVHIDINTKQSVQIPREFYDAVRGYEKSVEIISS